MSALPPRLAEILDDLSLFPDRADRVQALISISERFRPVEPSVASRPFDESHRVPGCESEAFAWTSASEGRLNLHFAVENPQGISAMAMAVILKDSLEGEAPSVAAQIPDDVVYEVFGRELSMGKSMGLMGMVQLVKAQAARLA